MIEHENSEAKPEAELIEQVFSFLRQHSDAFNGSSHVFGKYFVRKLLCSGKYSCVILAFDPQLRREVVLKIYRPCLLYTSPSPRDLSTSRMPSSA